MKFCTNCGAKLEESQRFCQKCGMEWRNEVQQSSIKREEYRAAEQKMSKTKKVWLSIASVCILLAIGAYIYGLKYYSAEAQINRIITIIQEGNTEKMVDVVTTDDPQLKIDENAVKSLFAYIKENPSYVSDLKDAMLQGMQQNQKEAVNPEAAYTSDFILAKEGKVFFLFDQYKLRAKSYYVTILTDEKDVTLKTEEKKLGKSNEKKYKKQFGPFFPGAQKFTAEFKSDYVTLKKEQKVALIDSEQQNVTVDLSLNGHYIEIDTNEAGAKLFANNKPVITINGDYAKWGPVATDGSIEIYLEKSDSGIVKRTKVEKITEDRYYTLNFKKEAVTENDSSNTESKQSGTNSPASPEQSKTETAKPNVTNESMQTFMERHHQAWIEAIQYKNFSILEPHLESDSPSYKDAKDYIAYLNKEGITEELGVVKVEKMEQLAEGKFAVTVYEEFMIFKPDKKVFKTFRAKYIVKVKDGNYMLSSTLENKELSAKEM